MGPELILAIAHDLNHTFVSMITPGLFFLASGLFAAAFFIMLVAVRKGRIR